MLLLIDLETAIHTACNAVEHYPSEWQEIEDEMRKLPVIEERKHGHWIRADKRFWECSECNYEKHIRRISEAGMYKTPYCPYCGAVMDEEVSDGR